MNAEIRYDVDAADYHADSGSEKPSLSSSMAKILCTQSPLHAWTAHPKLNPAWRPTYSDVFDRGHVAHAVLLQGMDVVSLITEAVDAKGNKKAIDDWRLQDAQRQREEARAAGKTPMLTHQYGAVMDMVNTVSGQFAQTKTNPRPFSVGRPEVTIRWVDEGVPCRARLDWLSESMECIDDLKTLVDANPETIARKAVHDGWDIQAAFYVRGIEVLTGYRPKFRFVAVEADAPYAASIFRAEGSLMDLGERKRRLALEIFRKCSESGIWSAYPTTLQDVAVPEYEMERWLAKEESYVLGV